MGLTGVGAPRPGETLTWQAGSKPHTGLVTAGIGAGAGVLAAGATALLLDTMPAMRRAGIIGGAFAGTSLAVAGGIALVHALTNRQPDKPDGSTTPRFPVAASVPGVPGVQAAEGAGVHVAGLYSTEESEQVLTGYDQNGMPQYSTQYHTEWHPFREDDVPGRQVGRFDGYDTTDQAVADMAGHGSVVVEQVGERAYAFQLPGRHIGDTVQSLASTNPAVRAVVLGDGTPWRRGAAGDQFVEGPTLPGVAAAGHDRGAEIASFALRDRSDKDVRIGPLQSSTSGYPTFAEALGDLESRAGDQVVISRNGRFVTADLDVPDVARDHDLLGVRTRGSGVAQAMELNGTVYGRDRDWWVVPKRER